MILYRYVICNRKAQPAPIPVDSGPANRPRERDAWCPRALGHEGFLPFAVSDFAALHRIEYTGSRRIARDNQPPCILQNSLYNNML